MKPTEEVLVMCDPMHVEDGDPDGVQWLAELVVGAVEGRVVLAVAMTDGGMLAFSLSTARALVLVHELHRVRRGLEETNAAGQERQRKQPTLRRGH